MQTFPFTQGEVRGGHVAGVKRQAATRSVATRQRTTATGQDEAELRRWGWRAAPNATRGRSSESRPVRRS